MATYTKKFQKPYTNGYKDRPDTSTPVTAAVKNMETDALLAIEEYLANNAISSVSASIGNSTGVYIATIRINDVDYRIYTPMVRYTSEISEGTKVGTLTFGNYSFDVYAPAASAGGSSVSVMPKTTEGTNIAEITVDGTTYQLYAPIGGGGSGSTVTAEATLTEGTEIGKITIDGKEIILYAPQTSSITVDAELSDTSENAIQNKAVDAAVKNLQQQIDAGGTGGSITVDSTLSTESENPVQNKVVTAELDKKLEVLGDDEQAPDAVKFVLDSELSLTSENGVKNKTIAQEFENYATGVKMVAKAAEAETAQTAESATTAETATKAAQDGNGNVIADTYAKKTEIPSGSAVDSELSETSTNPVQNKIVTNAIDECAKKTQIPTIIDLSDKLKNGRYNDYSLNDDFSKCYKINNIIYGQLFITGLSDDEGPNKRILVAAFDEDYFQDRTSDASFFCGYLEMLEGNGNIYSSDKNNRIQIPLVYDPINYEIEAISLEDDTLHFHSTTILSGYFRLIT